MRRSCVQTAPVGTPLSTNRVVHNATTNNASSTMGPVREAREVSEGNLIRVCSLKAPKWSRVIFRFHTLYAYAVALGSSIFICASNSQLRYQ